MPLTRTFQPREERGKLAESFATRDGTVLMEHSRCRLGGYTKARVMQCTP